MLQSVFSILTITGFAQKILTRLLFSPALRVLLFAVLFFTAGTANAHKISSWQSYKYLYEKEECPVLIKHLKSLPSPSDWQNNGLWSRSRILNAKCQLQLNNFKAALKSLELTPEAEGKDAWTFQKFRILLKSGKKHEAVHTINKLLTFSERDSYLSSLRKIIHKEYRSDQETRFIFPLLHNTRKNYSWFLKDYKIHAIYLRGAKLKGIKPDHKYRVLGWQFPDDEKTARLSHNNLSSSDFKNMTAVEVKNRVRTLARLGLNKYLIKHLPQLRNIRSIKRKNNLGEAYLKALFAERYYARIIKLHTKAQLSKIWSLPKESQYYWTALSYIKRKNIAAAKSYIYKLERLDAKAKQLPVLFDTFALRYKRDSKIKKAQFWWQRLLNNFPRHSLAAKSAWELAWSHQQQNNTNKALKFLKLGLKTRIYNSELRAKLLYWQGKLYQDIGRPDLAQKSFKKLFFTSQTPIMECA